MTMTWITAFFLALASAWAQPAIAPPRVGLMQDAQALRPIYGLAGNFVLGPAVNVSPSVAGKIQSEGFSGSLGMLKTDSSLVAFDAAGKMLGSIDAAPGAALFGFSREGSTALAYIPSSNSLFEWSGSGFAPVSTNWEAGTQESVLAIAFPNASEASLFVQRKDTLWELSVALGATGTASQTALVGVHGPVLALPSGDLVYSDATGLVLRRCDATLVHITASLPSSFSMQLMNQDWVQLTDLKGSARFALHSAPGREGFYQLPESSR